MMLTGNMNWMWRNKLSNV